MSGLFEEENPARVCPRCSRPSGSAALGCFRRDHHAPDTFDGATYEPEEDQARLSGLLGRVHELMKDGAWRGLQEIAGACKGTESSVSARLRDLRKERFGSHQVERRRQPGGFFEYRLRGRD